MLKKEETIIHVNGISDLISTNGKQVFGQYPCLPLVEYGSSSQFQV